MLKISTYISLLVFLTNAIYDASCFGIGGNLPTPSDPTQAPTKLLTNSPTKNPSAPPTKAPTIAPTLSPTSPESTDISFSFRIDLFVQSDNDVISAIDSAEQMARKQVEAYIANTDATLSGLTFSSSILDGKLILTNRTKLMKLLRVYR